MFHYIASQPPFLVRFTTLRRVGKAPSRALVIQDRSTREHARRRQVAYEAAILERDRMIAQAAALRLF